MADAFFCEMARARPEIYKFTPCMPSILPPPC
jgi:hypothetical protein